ncbi:MAG: hypothetical protein ACOCUA_02240, partial [archaeon]
MARRSFLPVLAVVLVVVLAGCTVVLPSADESPTRTATETVTTPTPTTAGNGATTTVDAGRIWP